MSVIKAFFAFIISLFVPAKGVPAPTSFPSPIPTEIVVIQATVTPIAPTLTIKKSQTIAGWNTYVNSDNNFEVSYPQNWIIEGFQKKSGRLSFYFQDSQLKEKQDNFFDRQNMFVGFQMTDPSPFVTIGELACISEPNCVSYYKTIDDVKAVVNTFEVPEGEGTGDKGRDIQFIKEGKLYEFFSGHNGIPQDSVSILANKTFIIDQIAGTFRSIK